MTDHDHDREDGAEGGARCGVCGRPFTEEDLAACHRGCPMGAGCNLVRCPACGAQAPRPGPVTRWLERLFGRRER